MKKILFSIFLLTNISNLAYQWYDPTITFREKVQKCSRDIVSKITPETWNQLSIPNAAHDYLTICAKRNMSWLEQEDLSDFSQQVIMRGYPHPDQINPEALTETTAIMVREMIRIIQAYENFETLNEQVRYDHAIARNSASKPSTEKCQSEHFIPCYKNPETNYRCQHDGQYERDRYTEYKNNLRYKTDNDLPKAQKTDETQPN